MVHLLHRLYGVDAPVLYPQNGDRIVAIDSVTSLRPLYKTAVEGLSDAEIPFLRMSVCLSHALAQNGIFYLEEH